MGQKAYYHAERAIGPEACKQCNRDSEDRSEPDRLSCFINFPELFLFQEVIWGKILNAAFGRLQKSPICVEDDVHVGFRW